MDTWFERVNAFAAEKKVNLEHYIISSGLKEIIEGCPISKEFKEIYACEFHYDENGVADWPRIAVNYTNKTQFLFRINKGILDVSNDRDLNAYIPEDERRIPFRNMIYIGDGMTDVPCMKLVRTNGGKSIAVYANHDRNTVNTLLMDMRVDYIARADYRPGSELEEMIRCIITKDAAESVLSSEHTRQMKAVKTESRQEKVSKSSQKGS